MTDAALLLLQLTCILGACRAVGAIAARVGQPRVVAEMLTGFLLGPSFFGWAAPALHATLFPASSLRVLSLISQLGLVLYMFCVGLEFRRDLVFRAGRRAVGLSVSGILGPMLLAALVARFLIVQGNLFTTQVSALQATLFLGTALSITAFPVLARIIGERGIFGTMIGTLALSAGAIDDAAAWMLLAGILGTLTGDTFPAAIAVVGGVSYVFVVCLLLQPLWRRLAATAERHETVTSPVMTASLACLMVGAWFTEMIGIHSVFGAFILGASLPRGELVAGLRGRIEPLAGTLLVPIFFVYAGLHTELQLVNTPLLWAITALVFAVACVGKGLPCWFGARLTGASNAQALAVATLMNARGMVELILIDIGLTRGVITPTLYTMLVLMAIGTTIMTGPLFTLVWARARLTISADEHVVSAGIP